jgi:hypothetical protein
MGRVQGFKDSRVKGSSEGITFFIVTARIGFPQSFFIEQGVELVFSIP